MSVFINTKAVSVNTPSVSAVIKTVSVNTKAVSANIKAELGDTKTRSTYLAAETIDLVTGLCRLPGGEKKTVDKSGELEAKSLPLTGSSGEFDACERFLFAPLARVNAL